MISTRLRCMVKVLTASSPARGLWALPLRDKLVFAQTMMKAKLQTRQPLRPYQQLRYWSNVPFRHGATDVVKYSATPHAGNPARPLQSNNPNALRDELIRHLNEDTTMSSFDFGLQFLDTEKMTYRGKRRDADFWIENPSVEWKETQSPFHTVGRLTLLPNSQLSADDVRGHVHRRDRELDAGQHARRCRQSRTVAGGVGEP